MKKVFIIVLSIAAIIAVSVLFVKKHISRIENHISSLFDIDISNCELIEEYNSHGGFLGDGESLYKMSCSSMKIDDKWIDLPLSEELDEALNLIRCDEEVCSNVYDRYNIETIEKGYYIFVDRHSESEDKSHDKLINSRSSYNFSIVIYDLYNKLLYCYELDT